MLFIILVGAKSVSKGKKGLTTRIFSIICTVLTALIFALAVGVIVNMIVCRAKNKPVSFFGTSFAIVKTPSMQPEIMVGDMILFKTCNYSDVKVGDYIVFVAGDGFGQIKGQNIVHEAIEITSSGIRTKGTNNLVADSDLVTEDNLIGICTYNSAGWGKVFTFISKYGIIIIIALIAVPFIVSQIIKTVKQSKQKGGADFEQDKDKTNDGETDLR